MLPKYGVGDKELARYVAELIIQLTTYGLPLSEAIREGWRVLYDVSWRYHETEGKGLFETIQGAKTNLNWAILMVNAHTGWNIDTQSNSWHIPFDLKWGKDKDKEA